MPERRFSPDARKSSQARLAHRRIARRPNADGEELLDMQKTVGNRATSEAVTATHAPVQRLADSGAPAIQRATFAELMAFWKKQETGKDPEPKTDDKTEESPLAPPEPESLPEDVKAMNPTVEEQSKEEGGGRNAYDPISMKSGGLYQNVGDETKSSGSGGTVSISDSQESGGAGGDVVAGDQKSGGGYAPYHAKSGSAFENGAPSEEGQKDKYAPFTGKLKSESGGSVSISESAEGDDAKGGGSVFENGAPSQEPPKDKYAKFEGKLKSESGDTLSISDSAEGGGAVVEKGAPGGDEEPKEKYAKFEHKSEESDISISPDDSKSQEVPVGVGGGVPGATIKLKKNQILGNKTKVKFIDTGEARKEFELNISGSITQNGAPFDTSKMYSKFMGDGFGIYVMGKDGKFYATSHKIGLFHHSSFLSGGDVAGAGEIKVVGGTLQFITNKSGHYWPGDRELAQTLNELQGASGFASAGLAQLLSGGGFRNPYEGGPPKFLRTTLSVSWGRTRKASNTPASPRWSTRKSATIRSLRSVTLSGRSSGMRSSAS